MIAVINRGEPFVIDYLFLGYDHWRHGAINLGLRKFQNKVSYFRLESPGGELSKID